MSGPLSPLSLAPAELITGELFGENLGAPPLPRPDQTARSAFEAALLVALRQPPCVVSFSGGRDSSAVLAVAAAVARREGLAPPVPVTLRFPGSTDADETAWQERVVRHLGVGDWQRIAVADELDFVGPLAGAALRRHGLLWPSNTHFHLPIIERARGGTVVTGFDGDTLLGSWRWLPGQQHSLRERLRGYRSRQAIALLPFPLRRQFLRRLAWAPHWLRPDGVQAVADLAALTWDVEPSSWSARVQWWWRRRYHLGTRRSLEIVARDAGVTMAHPFLDARFVAALAHEGGTVGLGDRTEMMRHLFGDVLPADTVARPTKAYFDDPMWNVHTRGFVRAWDGAGVDHELVDVEVLRREWQRERPHFASASLLQAAWLAQVRAEVSPAASADARPQQR